MQASPRARRCDGRRLLAAALAPALMALSLRLRRRAPASLPFVSRAFATNFSSEPGGGPPIEGGSAAGSYLVGRFMIESGDYAAAAESLDRALAADPENLDLRRQVFLLRLANGDDERALAAAASLVEIDAGADEPLLLLALDRVRAKHAQARDLLERVSERVPRAWSCRCSTPGPRSVPATSRVRWPRSAGRAWSSRSICSAATIAP